MKKLGFVMAIARSVNGSIFARSLERFSLMYDVILTDATSAAEIKRIPAAGIPSDRTRIKIAKVVNQKEVRIGRRIMYSAM